MYASEQHQHAYGKSEKIIDGHFIHCYDR